MKKVLVTGAGSGLGLEAAMRLAEKGFEDLRQRRSQTRARPRRAYLRPCSHSCGGSSLRGRKNPCHLSLARGRLQ